MKWSASLWAKLRRQRHKGQRLPQIPAGQRVYAIGDIHGRVDLLHLMHQQILADQQTADGASTVTVYLGDYVDRGADSYAVIDTLANQPPVTDTAIMLMGNHEELMLRFMDDAAVGRGWMQLGGDATLESYGVTMPMDIPPARRFEVMRETFCAKIPETHLTFLQSLSLHHQVGGCLFVHAGLRPRRALDRQLQRDLLWIREEFVDSPYDHGALVVHGHHVRPKPEIRDNRIGIDTGACYSGVLTCLVLEGDSWRFLEVGNEAGNNVGSSA